jgi:hypothetical protein
MTSSAQSPQGQPRPALPPTSADEALATLARNDRLLFEPWEHPKPDEKR